jgi:glycosyltransferase involved in cell wall biosynthesis
MNPLVSVILSVYNGEKYLEAAIESILEQTYSPLEIIIINDGSQDRTEQIATKYGIKIRYFYQSNQGQPAGLNYGLSMAKGAYIGFLDADDLYLPEKTAFQVEFLKKRPQIDFVFGHIEQFFDSELSQEARKKWVCSSATVPGYLAAAGLFRKECFEKVGLFNEKQRIGAFIEWYMRGNEKALQNELIPHLVLRRRIHGNNMGIHFRHCRQEYLQIVKEALKRRTHAQ